MINELKWRTNIELQNKMKDEMIFENVGGKRLGLEIKICISLELQNET